MTTDCKIFMDGKEILYSHQNILAAIDYFLPYIKNYDIYYRNKRSGKLQYISSVSQNDGYDGIAIVKRQTVWPEPEL